MCALRGGGGTPGGPAPALSVWLGRGQRNVPVGTVEMKGSWRPSRCVGPGGHRKPCGAGGRCLSDPVAPGMAGTLSFIY